MITCKMIKNGDNYKIDYYGFCSAIEEAERKWDISPADARACYDKISEIKEKDFKFVFSIGALVKRRCGHWEYLQLPFLDEDTEEMFSSSRCTRCVLNNEEAGE